MAYIDQVVDFITKNTQGQTLGVSGNQYVDPYTGKFSFVHGALNQSNDEHIDLRCIEISELCVFSTYSWCISLRPVHRRWEISATSACVIR